MDDDIDYDDDAIYSHISSPTPYSSTLIPEPLGVDEFDGPEEEDFIKSYLVGSLAAAPLGISPGTDDSTAFDTTALLDSAPSNFDQQSSHHSHSSSFASSVSSISYHRRTSP